MCYKGVKGAIGPIGIDDKNIDTFKERKLITLRNDLYYLCREYSLELGLIKSHESDDIVDLAFDDIDAFVYKLQNKLGESYKKH